MNEKSKDASSPRQSATKLVTGGRDPMSYHGFVNPPVYHASTVLYRSAEDFLAHRARYQYGRRGTPTTEALESRSRRFSGRRSIRFSTACWIVAGSVSVEMPAPPERVQEPV